MDGWEYRLKTTTEEGEWIKNVATSLGMTNKGLIMSGVKKMEQGSVEMNIDAIQDQLHELTEAIVNMQRVINTFSPSVTPKKVADPISPSFFD